MNWRLGAVLCGALLAAGCTTTVTQTRSAGGSTALPDAREAPAGSQEGDATRRARTRMERASAYFGRGQLDVALEQVKLALAADASYGPAYNLRGLIQSSQGDDGAAEESFRRALQINARDVDAMNNDGWFLSQRKRYGEAQAQFDLAVAQPGNRDPARTLLAKGVCLAFDKQYAESERQLTRALQLDPGNPAIGTNLAEVQYRLGDYNRARESIRRVNNQAGVASAQTLWLAARIERRQGNNQAVADFGSRLRSQFPDSPEAVAFDRGRWSE